MYHILHSMDGTVIGTVVQPSDFIMDLKVQLEPESDIPAQNQNLSMGGFPLDSLLKTIDDYGIQVGAILDLEPKAMSITVESQKAYRAIWRTLQAIQQKTSRRKTKRRPVLASLSKSSI